VACPFFMPAEKLENGLWPHPARLPLGCGWTGRCTAPGYDGETPSVEELHECNLGYAESCRRLPKDRAWDSVRFFVIGGDRATNGEHAHKINGDCDDQKSSIQFRYVCERRHLPVEHGIVEFEMKSKRWTRCHADARVQRMAQCYLESYLERCTHREIESAAS